MVSEIAIIINNCMKKYYTIYQTTNLINNKTYIGKHETTKPNDGYYGSGKAIKAAIKKHGKENFKKEILHIFETEDEMNRMEKELITEEFVAKADTYNAGVGGEGGAHFKGKKHTKEVREKISLANKIKTPAQIAGMKKAGEMSKGRKLSEQARKNIAAGARKRIRKPWTEEQKQAHSIAMKEWYKKRNISV